MTTKNSREHLNTKMRRKLGYHPSEEACLKCSRAEGHHHPDGIPHDFVPSGLKARDPRVSTGRYVKARQWPLRRLR